MQSATIPRVISTVPGTDRTDAPERGAPPNLVGEGDPAAANSTCSTGWLGGTRGTARLDREALFADFAPLVSRLVRQYGDDSETRRDLQGEIYWRFMAFLDAYDPSRGVPLRPYLVRQLTVSIFNYARGNRRNRKREASLEAQPETFAFRYASDPTSGWDHEMMTERVQRALPAMVARLPERQRKLVVWRYYESRSFEEIAERLSIEVATARSLLRNGLNNLRKWVAADGLEWEPA